MNKKYKEPKIRVVTIRVSEVILNQSVGVETEGEVGLSFGAKNDAIDGLSKDRNADNWEIF